LKERYPRVARYYQLAYDEQQCQLTCLEDLQRKQKAESLDGSYLLKSSRNDLSAEDIWRTYVLLTRVEAAFRAMKSPLCERPIFHHLERRVETHIFLCVLAYHLLVCIERAFLERIRLTNHTGDTVAEFRRLVSNRPGAWGEFSDPIDWEASQTRQDRAKVDASRDLESPAGFDDRDDGCNAWAGFLAADMDPIPSSNGDRTHRVLGQVVTQLQLGMFQETG
jgi:hypothetical protein